MSFISSFSSLGDDSSTKYFPKGYSMGAQCHLPDITDNGNGQSWIAVILRKATCLCSMEDYHTAGTPSSLICWKTVGPSKPLWMVASKPMIVVRPLITAYRPLLKTALQLWPCHQPLDAKMLCVPFLLREETIPCLKICASSSTHY